MTDCKKLRWKTQERFEGDSLTLHGPNFISEPAYLQKQTKTQTVSQNLTARPSLSSSKPFSAYCALAAHKQFQFLS